MSGRAAVLNVTAAVLATACLVGCGSEIAPAAGTDGGFDGEWTLVSGTLDGQPLQLTAGARVTLTVDGGEVSGRSACNSYSGAMEADGDSVTFAGLGGTDMGCEPDVMAVETAYHQAMSRVTTSAATADTLTLTGPGVDLDFEPVAPVVALPLVGTPWVLESIATGSEPDASVGTSISAPSTAVFKTDGTFSTLTACKERGGTWLEVGGLIVTELIIHPTPSCGPDVELEASQVLAVIRGPFTATIAGDQLTLSLSNGPSLVYRAADSTPASNTAG